ncbi:MAG: enoyl-ACP reductase FabI [Rickettsiaceae bacterium]|nr:enoyl-ACP reductase FabI [Rickettsiaceae bacterium]
MINLRGKRGLVFGIANDHSISYGCAKALRAAGADLAISYLNEKAGEYVKPLAQELEASIIKQCDLKNAGDLEALFKIITEKWGKLDFLIHSVAFAPIEDLHAKLVDCSEGGFLESMNISCYSLIKMAKLSEPLMKDGGSIVTMSYYGGDKVIKHYNMMGVVKAALESTVRYLASDLGSKKIRVNTISPGPIMTRAASGIQDFSKLCDDNLCKTFLGRGASIDGVGNLAAFLVSNLSEEITAQIHYVDCGASSAG